MPAAGASPIAAVQTAGRHVGRGAARCRSHVESVEAEGETAAWRTDDLGGRQVPGWRVWVS